MTWWAAAFLLFLVMDPIGNIPLFLSALKNVPPERRMRIILRESLIALAVLLFFLVFGKYLLTILQLEEPSLSMAGGIILFMIAIKMIFPLSEDDFHSVSKEEPFIVPLAVPFLAGPSAMSTVLLLITREPGKWGSWLAALFCAWFFSTLILMASGSFSRFLGNKGLVAMERLMGMLLTPIAVQLFLTGLEKFLGWEGAGR